MPKYDKAPADPYVDVQTGLLRNSVGAQSQSELDRIEAAFSAVRSYELERSPAAGRFDLEHLRAIHRKLFSDVYPWAGELRSVAISKGKTHFAMPEHIEGAGKALFKQLARERLLQGLDAAEFSNRAGHYLGEFNVLHPFRDGNGRAQRAFLNQLADAAGYHIAWDRMSRETMTVASIEAYQGSSDKLAQLIGDNLTDRDHAKALELARSLAGREVQVTHAQEGESYSGRVLGSTDRYIVQERANAAEGFVLHARQRVVGDVDKMFGKQTEIRYPQGDVGIVMPEKGKGVEGPEKSNDYDRGGGCK